MNIRNNTILITGGGSGIGLSLAAEFLRNGNQVIISGRNPDKLKSAKKKYPELEIIPCDISSEESVAALVAEISEKYPSLNVLINNAGTMGTWNILKPSNSIAGQKAEIMTNLFGTIQLTQSLIPQLVKQEQSFILTVSSGLAYAPFSAFPVYCATKAALHSYTISIREQLAKTNIRVFELLAPLIDTEMVAGVEMSMDKMSTEKLTAITMEGIENDKYEIKPGMATMMGVMSRLLPSLIQKSLSKESAKILSAM